MHIGAGGHANRLAGQIGHAVDLGAAGVDDARRPILRQAGDDLEVLFAHGADDGGKLGHDRDIELTAKQRLKGGAAGLEGDDIHVKPVFGEKVVIHRHGQLRNVEIGAAAEGDFGVLRGGPGRQDGEAAGNKGGFQSMVHCFLLLVCVLFNDPRRRAGAAGR